MKVKFIKCMDMEFEDVEVINIHTDIELNKAIEESKVVGVTYEGGDRYYINADYIMYWG